MDIYSTPSLPSKTRSLIVIRQNTAKRDVDGKKVISYLNSNKKGVAFEKIMCVVRETIMIRSPSYFRYDGESGVAVRKTYRRDRDVDAGEVGLIRDLVHLRG